MYSMVALSDSILCHGASASVTALMSKLLSALAEGHLMPEKSHKNLRGVSQSVRKCHRVSRGVRACHALQITLVSRYCRVRELEIPCGAWRQRLLITWWRLQPRPALAGFGLARTAPGTERVTPCLPGRSQRVSQIAVTANCRNGSDRDERGTPWHRRGNHPQAV